ncbi:MAG: 5'-nucleotidase C-terminal domain-containing protein, partial [Alicyclobacillus sp.]|nr:5'-nucleotidase C-terminal domain-containing protein [Alicyclobacillus sp.]
VGVFGLTAAYEGTYASIGVQVRPPASCARTAVQALQEQGCDVVVCLSHLGLWRDRQLAAEVPGITVILGSHSHHLMPAVEWVGSTAIFQAGKHGLTFGHTVVEFDEATHACTDVRATAIPLADDAAPDVQMLSTLRGYMPDIEAALSRPVLHTERPLPTRYDEESDLPNVLVDALYAAYPVDIGIMMSGALTASLMPGTVSLRDLLGACRTPTRPVLMTSSGAELVSVIDKALQPEYFARPGVGFGFRGSVVGLLALANAKAIVRIADDRMVLEQLWIHGEPAQPEKAYRVVTCEYLWLSPVFEEFRQGRDIAFGKPLVRDVLIARIGDAALLQQASIKRYVVNPMEAQNA